MSTSVRTKLSAFVQRRLLGDRRTARRLAPGQRTLCLVQFPDGQGEGVVQNLSVKGLGLLTDRPHPPGEVLAIRLINAGHTHALPLEARIARCFRAGDGQFFLGVAFTRPLQYEELLPFLV
jgi:hypothetical protein